MDSVVPVLLSIDKSQSVFLEEMAAKLQDAEKTVLDGLQDCMSTILGEVNSPPGFRIRGIFTL